MWARRVLRLPSGACPESRARQEALQSFAQEQRKPNRPGVGKGGGHSGFPGLASVSLPQPREMGPDVEAQKPPGSREPGVPSRPMGVKAGRKGSRNRHGRGRGRQECLCWEKVGSKHLEGPPGQRQTLRSLLLPHSPAPAPLPPAIRALGPSRPSRLRRHHGQVTPAAVAAAAAHPLWPRCR